MGALCARAQGDASSSDAPPSPSEQLFEAAGAGDIIKTQELLAAREADIHWQNKLVRAPASSARAAALAL